MEKTEQRKILQDWREKFKSFKAKDATPKMYSRFYEDIERAGLIDTNYTEHMKKAAITLTAVAALVLSRFIFRLQDVLDVYIESRTLGRRLVCGTNGERRYL